MNTNSPKITKAYSLVLVSPEADHADPVERKVVSEAFLNLLGNVPFPVLFLMNYHALVHHQAELKGEKRQHILLHLFLGRSPLLL